MTVPAIDNRDELRSVLAEAQSQGFLGPGPVEPHIERALDLGSAVPTPPATAVDLGSGGGLPGLPLAMVWPHTSWILLDAGTKRAAFLREAVARLDLTDRVEVIARRAEEAGRSNLRGAAECVVARSFGPPAVTAECAAPLLKVGGILVVAEPPGGDPARWDPKSLALLGMSLGRSATHPTAYQTVLQETSCPERFPRRTGVPNKRPLF